MTIDDQYRIRREHQQALLAEVEEQRFANSGDRRIQLSSPISQTILSTISGWLSWLNTEPANANPFETQRPVDAELRPGLTQQDHLT